MKEPSTKTTAIENMKELIAELDRFKKEGRALEHSPMAYFLANNAKVLLQQLEASEAQNKRMREALVTARGVFRTIVMSPHNADKIAPQGVKEIDNAISSLLP